MPTLVWPPGEMAIHFLVKKPLLIWSPLIRPNSFGPLVTLLKGFYCITEQSQEGKVSLTKQITVRTQRSFLREILNVFLVGTWIVDQALLEKKKKLGTLKKKMRTD